MSIEHLIAAQKRQALLAEELGRLQLLYERTGLSSVARLMKLRATEASGLILPDHPMFAVPKLVNYQFGLKLGTAKVRLNQDAEPDIRIPVDALLCMALIAGRIKSGKSRLLLDIFRQLTTEAKRTRAWLFVSEGSELTILDTLKQPDLLVLRPGLNWNPSLLSPVENATRRSADALFRSLSAVTWLGSKSAGLLMPILESLLQEVEEGSHHGMQDIIRLLQATRRSEIKETLLNKMALIDFQGKEPLNHELMNKANLAIDLSNLTPDLSQVLFNFLLAMVVIYRSEKTDNQYRDPESQDKLILLADEAARLLPGPSTREDLALLPVVSATRDLRKNGCGLVIALQRVSAVEPSIVSMAHTVIAGPVHHEQDVRLLRGVLGLDGEHGHARLEALRTLSTRQFIVRHDGDLFPITTPTLELGSTPWTDARVNEWNREVLKLHPEWMPLLATAPGRHAVPSFKKDDFITFLEAVAQNALPFGQLLEKLGWSTAKAYPHRDRALTENLIELQTTTDGGRGFQKFASLTPFAEERFHVQSCMKSRGGSPAHGYWMVRLRLHFIQQGHRVTKEAWIKESSHPVDLLVDDLPVEVSLDNQKEADNIRANLKTHGKCLVLSNSREHLDSLKAQLTLDESPNVQFKLFCEVLDHGSSR